MKTGAKWICSPKEANVVDFYKKIALSGKVKKATLGASAMGLYLVRINGKRITDSLLNPGWTSYHVRTQYQTYDVTAFLGGKSAEISVTAAEGWAVGDLTWKGRHHVFSDTVSVIAWLDVEYADGREEHFATDDTWGVRTSKILYSEIYHGETVDPTARIKKLGTAELSRVKTKLIPQVGELIHEHERIAPKEFIITPKGERVIDFGQNMTGYVEVRIKGERGGRIVMTHAEVLDAEGNFYNENLRSARSRNEYILSGGEDVFKPTFSFQGFRYIRLDEYPFEEVDLNCFTAVAVYSDMERTGFFSCGNAKVNQLYHNVLWGQRSNYLDVPTDCPQRDERLGWTGDAQVFCRAGAYNFGVHDFFRKWLGDMAAEQSLRNDGGVPIVVPDALQRGAVCCAWGDAAGIIPWEVYLAYGDKKMLAEHFPMMKKWVEYIRHAGTKEYLWVDRWHYGDWLAMDGVVGGDTGATQKDLIASAYYARVTDILVKAGKLLGKDMSEYEELYRHILDAFHDNFIENGLPCMSKHISLRDEKNRKEQAIIKPITQTTLAMILHFHLYRGEDERKSMADCLAKIIHENGDRINTGFVGTPYILHALSENGYTDLAYTLLLQEKMPSWLYSVNHGATTMWERWNCINEDGSFSSVSMTSFNHYAYGAVADWLYGVCAGINSLPDGAGYKHIALAPKPSKNLGFVNCRIKTVSGEVISNWYYSGEFIHYEFSVPAGTVAELTLPDGRKETLCGGEYIFTTKA
ncbi:MAG TPA: alfa-L-rhamnosidase [Clostridiales bacterium]|nr:alfa-L-rhamnosidase [Candidatus Apopatosoma intestinale]